jgi:hypothetical protein
MVDTLKDGRHEFLTLTSRRPSSMTIVKRRANRLRPQAISAEAEIHSAARYSGLRVGNAVFRIPGAKSFKLVAASIQIPDGIRRGRRFFSAAISRRGHVGIRTTGAGIEPYDAAVFARRIRQGARRRLCDGTVYFIVLLFRSAADRWVCMPGSFRRDGFFNDQYLEDLQCEPPSNRNFMIEKSLASLGRRH